MVSSDLVEEIKVMSGKLGLDEGVLLADYLSVERKVFGDYRFLRDLGFVFFGDYRREAKGIFMEKYRVALQDVEAYNDKLWG